MSSDFGALVSSTLKCEVRGLVMSPPPPCENPRELLPRKCGKGSTLLILVFSQIAYWNLQVVTGVGQGEVMSILSLFSAESPVLAVRPGPWAQVCWVLQGEAFAGKLSTNSLEEGRRQLAAPPRPGHSGSSAPGPPSSAPEPSAASSSSGFPASCPNSGL